VGSLASRQISAVDRNSSNFLIGEDLYRICRCFQLSSIDLSLFLDLGLCLGLLIVDSLIDGLIVDSLADHIAESIELTVVMPA
jgi:hypothetical protein